MDRNNYVGLFLMLVLLVGYSFWSNQRAKVLKAEEDAKKVEQLKQDSLNQALNPQPDTESLATKPEVVETEDSLQIQTEQQEKAEYQLGNDDLKLTFSNYGGRINQAELLKYESYQDRFDGNEQFVPLKLYTEDHSKFNWSVNGVNSQQLVYEVNQGDNFIEFTNSEHNIKQRYSLDDADPYLIHYSVSLPEQEAELEWETNFVLQEHDMRSEREFTFFAYKDHEGKFKKIKKLKDDVLETVPEPLDFIVERQRFFSQTLFSDGLFSETTLHATYDKDDLVNIKSLDAKTNVKFDNGVAELQIFIAPNDRSVLSKADKSLAKIQPSGVFGLTKAFSWMFNQARPYFSNYGLLILVMTLVIKLILTPLTYRSYLSQAKMSVLKPEISELKEKYKDDQAKFSQEQMKLYNKAGVNPLGGCIPSLIQIPIFISLYYFFRTSIFFRQKSFLWANDLSTYDEFIHLPFKLPFLGDHISLFAILYGVALFFSMQMNSSMMSGGMPTAPSSGGKDGGDMQQMMQTQMKIMQYAMPIFLPVIFNSFPAALTFYYFCYNMINGIQSWIIKNYIIDEDKIHAQIQENKAKPKKTSGFRKRLEDAMKMQQELQEQQTKNKKK